MAAAGSYKLELEPPKRNVFVTQLNEREDEEEDSHSYPVVKDSASKLVETGLNTLQKTLLLKKEVEVDQVDAELCAKREEFRQRMDACTQRQLDLQKKQQKMKGRILKFEKFIKDNEAKRRRAIQKYQEEVKMKEQKTNEFELLCQQLQEIRNRHDFLHNKLAKYKKFEDYLLRVLDILPPHYLEVQDSMLTSLMMRHRTLSTTNVGLVDNLNGMSDQMDELRLELDHLKQEHNKMKLSINSRLSRMQKEQENKSEKNQQSEQTFGLGKKELRKQRAEVGQMFMAINNITEKCQRRMDPDLDDLTLQEKLDIIKEYINDRSDVYKMASAAVTGTSCPASEKKTQHGTKTKRAHFQ